MSQGRQWVKNATNGKEEGMNCEKTLNTGTCACYHEMASCRGLAQTGAVRLSKNKVNTPNHRRR